MLLSFNKKLCKLIQFNDNVDDVSNDFIKSHSTFENNKYTKNNVAVIHNELEFNNFIELMQSNTEILFVKVAVLYESILMTNIDMLNNSDNIEKLKSIVNNNKLDYVIVCGNHHSLEYLWGSDSFIKMFLE